MAAFTFFGSENDGILSRSTTTDFTFLATVTASTPPPADRRGRGGGAAFRVAERDARDEPLVLAHRAAERDRDLLAVPGVQHPLGLEVALAEVGPGVVELDGAVLLEVDHHPVRGSVEQGEARDVLLAEPVAEAAAPVGLLDPAGQRALAAHAGWVGVGEARAREGPRREDERVGRGERVDSSRTQLEQGLGDEVAAGLHDRLAGELSLRVVPVAQADVVVDAHRSLLAGQDDGGLACGWSSAARSDAPGSTSSIVSAAGSWDGSAGRRARKRIWGSRPTAWRRACSQRMPILMRSGSLAPKRRSRVISNSSTP